MEDRDIILNTAFNGKAPMVDYDFEVEPIKTEVVYDSRYDLPSLSVLMQEEFLLSMIIIRHIIQV